MKIRIAALTAAIVMLCGSAYADREGDLIAAVGDCIAFIDGDKRDASVFELSGWSANPPPPYAVELVSKGWNVYSKGRLNLRTVPADFAHLKNMNCQIVTPGFAFSNRFVDKFDGFEWTEPQTIGPPGVQTTNRFRASKSKNGMVITILAERDSDPRAASQVTVAGYRILSDEE